VTDNPRERELAHEVTARLTRFWIGVAKNIAITATLYALLAAMPSVRSWVSSITGGPASGPYVALTIAPDDAAAILAVLASIVIALNVSVWASRSAEISEEIAHTRRRYLALCGSATGTIALFTGLATLFHDAPDRTGIDAVLLLWSAVFIAVLGNDTGLILGDDIPVQRQIPHVELDTRITALERVASRWEGKTVAARGHIGIRVTIDLLAAAALTAVPIVAAQATRDLNGASVEWWRTLGGAAVVGSAAVLLAAYTFLSTARSFVTRYFGNAAMSSIAGGVMYLTVALGLGAVALGPTSTDGVALVVIALFLAMLIPPILIMAQLRASAPLRAPGSTVREFMYRSIVRDLVKARAEQARTPVETKARRFARVRDWSDRVTGLSADPSTVAGAASEDATDTDADVDVDVENPADQPARRRSLLGRLRPRRIVPA
jgi:hypothetical protein